MRAPYAPYTDPGFLAQGDLCTFAYIGTVPVRCDGCNAVLLRDQYDEFGREHLVNVAPFGALWLCPSCYWPAVI